MKVRARVAVQLDFVLDMQGFADQSLRALAAMVNKDAKDKLEWVLKTSERETGAEIRMLGDPVVTVSELGPL